MRYNFVGVTLRWRALAVMFVITYLLWKLFWGAVMCVAENKIQSEQYCLIIKIIYCGDE
jgi:hypothetical protein